MSRALLGDLLSGEVLRGYLAAIADAGLVEVVQVAEHELHLLAAALGAETGGAVAERRHLRGDAGPAAHDAGGVPVLALEPALQQPLRDPGGRHLVLAGELVVPPRP